MVFVGVGLLTSTDIVLYLGDDCFTAMIGA